MTTKTAAAKSEQARALTKRHQDRRIARMEAQVTELARQLQTVSEHERRLDEIALGTVAARVRWLFGF